MGLPRRKVQPLLLFLPWKDLGKCLNHSWLLWSLSPRTNPLPNFPLTGVSKGIPKKYHVRFLRLVYIFHHASSGKSKNDKVLSLFFPYSFQRCWPLTHPPTYTDFVIILSPTVHCFFLFCWKQNKIY